ncbi:tumor necrosis factor receptor superfamily member 3 isoform X3 [Toxotes jaculatrix]|uniref:tumor necrosis factor receptor superfamily member 3 isoform X3 n=1 Tax=Toxotes jaculatrix TaxID=941984 RepID=UPI001B3AE7D4|nr:tumor necrosis factor receptor superfamily member 3 isoform X3 [Toxotes jaculatrix]
MIAEWLHFSLLFSFILTFRGSQATSCVTFSSTCKETQYAWPMDTATSCCNKCPPGQYMVRRSTTSCETECASCMGDRYIDSYNVEMSCTICKTCIKPNMEYKSQCNATHDAVCGCKAGYRCKDQPCTQCVLISDFTKPWPSLSTTTSTPEDLTTLRTPPRKRDTVWFLVIISLLCTGITLAVVTKIKPLLCWIRSKHGYFLTPKAVPGPPVTPYSEDEEVSKPVQEVCGKCDQPIDV